jgi:Tfp pilus assembly protein PilN
MIKINLLSPADKDSFKWEKINNLIKSFILWTLLVQAIFILVFLFALEYLKIEQKSATEHLEQIRNQENTKEMNKIEQNLSEYAKKIDSIAGLRANHLHWSYVLEKIIDITPNGVRLENISSKLFVADAKQSPSGEEKFRIDVTGNAITRKDLLIFEDSLKKSELFSDIECDDSNYVESSDIDFRYSFYVYKSKLLE